MRPSETSTAQRSIGSSKRSIRSSIQPLAAGSSADPALIDTSVAIAIDEFEAELRNHALDASTLTLAELMLGTTGAADAAVRARRNRRLRRLDRRVRWLDFDSGCALAYGQVCLATIKLGRRARGSRSVDLMIAATALA